MTEKKIYTLRIDPELSGLIPALSPEEKALLEKSITGNGCLEPILAWNETVVDGHNRYDICNRLQIPFAVENVSFANRAEAKLFMLEKQCGRRNLSTFARVELALKLSPEIEEKARKNQAVSLHQNSDKVNTLDELAGLSGVSRDTVYRVKKIIDYVKEHPEMAGLLPRLRSREISINEAYREVKDAEYPRFLIDNEIRYCIPPWDDDSRAWFEVDLIKNRMPQIVHVWGKTIVWGFTEYELARKHGIEICPVLLPHVNTKEEAIAYRIRRFEHEQEYDQKYAIANLEKQSRIVSVFEREDPELKARNAKKAEDDYLIFEKVYPNQ